jgi:hypothetical protein
MNTEQGHKVSRPLKTVHMSQVELLSHDLIHALCVWMCEHFEKTTPRKLESGRRPCSVPVGHCRRWCVALGSRERGEYRADSRVQLCGV